MASDERGEERGFKVADRRRFSETGEARETTDAPDSLASAGEQRTAESAQADDVKPTHDESHAEHGHAHDPIDFSTFVISLSAQALAHLGEIPDPMLQGVQVDIEAARQVIDILGLLQEKTKGNLDSAEAPLLERVLYDLRMKYVESVRGR